MIAGICMLSFFLYPLWVGQNCLAGRRGWDAWKI